MIIGVSGPNGAGKGEVVRYLEERSFCAHSLSDVIREVLAARAEVETREVMIEAGRALRAEGGVSVLADRLLPRLTPDRNHVVDSIRHSAEVEALRTAGGQFCLIWVDADPRKRLERLRARGRSGDPDSLSELERLEAREAGGQDPAAQQLTRVRELADHSIQNDGGLDELHDAVQRILGRSLFFERPSWDEYFMSIAQRVASRSNCVKRKVGTVVTVDRRIVSTGYNGTPRGTRNCNEGGCPRCNQFAAGGTKLDECMCSHGEENAITQAAYHGVTLRDSLLYTTLSPCLGCTKLIINAGIHEVVYNASYPLGETSLSMLREAGVKLRRFEPADPDGLLGGDP